MNTTISKWGVGVLALFLVLGTSVPVNAQTLNEAPVGVYVSHNDDEDEDEYRSYRRSGYSSSLRRKIDKLDNDPVEEMPIPVVLGVAVRQLQDNFGDPRDGGARTHEGLDIMAPRGAAVASPTEAVVTRTGEGSSSGIYVQTANPGGEIFNYYHLDEIADGIKAGVELKVGDIIGYVGDTGNAKGTSPHLHFEIREGRTATDPLPRLTEEFPDKVRIAVLTDLLEELQKELARLLRNA
ncbi:M23 family metallopeptidase [Patescibacteria group bacterium]|nr:M23 family metallopeptidase [Patescibacteria group bacterium]